MFYHGNLEDGMISKLNLSRQITIYLIHAWIFMVRVKIRIKFNGSFLNRFPPTILHGDILNIYTVYETTSNYSDIDYPTLENCLFRSVKLAKNDDIDKYGYSGYGIGFDRKTSFSVGNEISKNVIIKKKTEKKTF